MRILLVDERSEASRRDECVPKPLKRKPRKYQIRTVVEMGWSGMKNGELLNLMQQEGFKVLLTTDQNLRHQQNLKKTGVAIVVMVALSNRLADLIPLVPNVSDAIERIVVGEVIEVTL